MSVPLYANETPLADPAGVSLTDIATGKAAFDATTAVSSSDEKRINIVDRKTGEVFSVPESQLPSAIKQGYQPESAEQAAIRAYVRENKGLGGATAVALDKFADWATFGVTDAIVDSELNDFQRAKREALLHDHKVASALGGALGFGASLFYGGEVFDAASAGGSLVERTLLGTAEHAVEKAAVEKIAGEAVGNELARLAPEGAEKLVAKAGPSFGRKLIAAGAGNAVEGAILTAPRAITETALGDPETAAESILSGMGIAMLFGVVGAGAKAVLGKTREKLASIATGTIAATEQSSGIDEESGLGQWAESKLRDFSDKEAIKSFNPLKKYSKKIDKIGEEDVAAVAKKYDLMPKFGESAEDVAEKVANKKTEVGKKIGSIVSEASGAAPRVSAGEVASSMEKVAEGFETGQKALGAGPVRKKLRELAEDAVKAFPNDLSLEELDAVRQFLGKNIPESEKSEGMRFAIGEAYHRLNDLFFEKAEAAITNSGGDATKILEELQGLKADYRALVPLADATQDNIARGLSNRAHSLTDYLGNIIGANIGGAVGGPIGVGLGALVGGQINKYGRAYGNTYLAKSADALAEIIAGKGSGLVGIEQWLKAAAEKVDQIPGVLADIAKGAAIEQAAHKTMGQGQGQDQDQDHFIAKPTSIEAFTTFATELTNLHSDPPNMLGKLEELSKPFGTEAPTITAHLATKSNTAVEFLYKALPKPPDPANPYANSPPWRPSDQALQDFARKTRVIVEPFSIIDRLKDKTLSTAEVEAMRTVYPKLWSALVAKIVQHAANGEAKPIAYDYQVKLGILLGQPIGGATEHVGEFQRIYARPEPSGPPPQGGPVPHGRRPGTSSRAMLHLPSTGTETQRLALKT